MQRGYHDTTRSDSEFEAYDRNEVLDTSAQLLLLKTNKVLSLCQKSANDLKYGNNIDIEKLIDGNEERFLIAGKNKCIKFNPSTGTFVLQNILDVKPDDLLVYLGFGSVILKSIDEKFTLDTHQKSQFFGFIDIIYKTDVASDIRDEAASCVNIIYTILGKQWIFNDNILIESIKGLRFSNKNTLTIVSDTVSFTISCDTFVPDHDPATYNFIYDDWRIGQIKSWNPTVVMIFFGEKGYPDQFRYCIKSLFEIGNFDGNVYVITNHSDAYIKSIVPNGFKKKVFSLFVNCSEKIDYYLAKLKINEFDQLKNAAPLVLSDLDIIYDRNILKLLISIRGADSISAQSELRMSCDTTSLGKPFADRDNEFSSKAFGFNSGFVCVPDMKKFGFLFDYAYKTHERFTKIFGVDSVPWCDQSALNYVCQKLARYDGAIATDVVRVPNGGDPLTGADARGVVHFWTTTGDAAERADYMKNYLDQLYSLK